MSTVKKSQARIDSPCARRKVRHDCASRRGAGGNPALTKTLRTKLAETAMPSLRSSPAIRRYRRLIGVRALLDRVFAPHGLDRLHRRRQLNLLPCVDTPFPGSYPDDQTEHSFSHQMDAFPEPGGRG